MTFTSNTQMFVLQNMAYVIAIVAGLITWTIALALTRKCILERGFFTWVKGSRYWTRYYPRFKGLTVKWSRLGINPGFFQKNSVIKALEYRQIRPLQYSQLKDEQPKNWEQPQWRLDSNEGLVLSERRWRPWYSWTVALRLILVIEIAALLVGGWMLYDHFRSDEQTVTPTPQVTTVSEVGGGHIPPEPVTLTPEPTETPTPEPETVENDELVIDLQRRPESAEDQIINWLEKVVPNIYLPTLPIDTGLDLTWLNDLFSGSTSGCTIMLEKGLVIVAVNQRGDNTEMTLQFATYELEPQGHPVTISGDRFTLRGGELKWGVRYKGNSEWKINSRNSGNVLINAKASASQPLKVSDMTIFRWWMVPTIISLIVLAWIIGYKS